MRVDNLFCRILDLLVFLAMSVFAQCLFFDYWYSAYIRETRSVRDFVFFTLVPGTIAVSSMLIRAYCRPFSIRQRIVIGTFVTLSLVVLFKICDFFLHAAPSF